MQVLGVIKWKLIYKLKKKKKLILISKKFISKKNSKKCSNSYPKISAYKSCDIVPDVSDVWALYHGKCLHFFMSREWVRLVSERTEVDFLEIHISKKTGI